jgi:hypothetical protein
MAQIDQLSSHAPDVASAPLEPDNAISQMISNLLSTSYSDTSLRQALVALDSRIDKNTVEARRHLRSDVEASVVKAGGQGLKEFSKLYQKLKELGDTISDLNGEFKGMETMMTHATKSTSQVVRESLELRRNEENITVRSALLDAFQNVFVVSPSEVEILSSPIQDNGRFFEVLEKVKKIHHDCQALLATEESSKTGIDIMNTMSTHLDKAYENVFFCVQQNLKKMSSDQYMRISRDLRKALSVLAERPALFDSALNGLADSRQKNLASEFVKALTVEKNAKPIDFYAYDVLRYVGDIMAWIHSGIVNELEIFEALLEGSAASEGRIDKLVDKTTSSVIKPFRLRVEQVINSEERITIIYKVSSVLHFYYSTFQKSLHGDAAIMTTISRLEEACLRQFNKCLEMKIGSVKTDERYPDLQPPEFLSDALGDLKAVLSTYEASISYNQTASESLKQTIHDLVEPYLEYCSRIAGDLPSIDSEIFLINCYDAVKVTLALFVFASYKVGQLDNRSEELVEVLVQRQYQKFRASSGLLKANLQDKRSVAELAAAMDNFLPAATMESGILMRGLSSPRLAASVTLRASTMFLDTFKALKQELETIYGNEEALTLLPRSVEEVKTLLAI